MLRQLCYCKLNLRFTMNNDQNNNNANWADTATAFLSKMSGLNTEFGFDFDNMEVNMPGASGNSQWRLNGTLRIRIRSSRAGEGSTNR